MGSLGQNDVCLLEKRVFAVVATVTFMTVLKSRRGCQRSLKWIRCLILWRRDKFGICWHSVLNTGCASYSRCILQLELLGFLRLIHFWGLGNCSWTVVTKTLLNVCLSLGFHGCVLNKFWFAILLIFWRSLTKPLLGETMLRFLRMK